MSYSASRRHCTEALVDREISHLTGAELQNSGNARRLLDSIQELEADRGDPRELLD